jgi:hypothetical protein
VSTPLSILPGALLTERLATKITAKEAHEEAAAVFVADFNTYS